MHPKKPNKVRVVFDASTKYKNDSLNNHLLKGLDLINNLVSILIQFRLEKYAVTANIEQMFHQIKAKKGVQDALRFLWRIGHDSPSIWKKQFPLLLKIRPEAMCKGSVTK